MTEYGATLGVPNTGKVEGVGERKYPGQEPQQKPKQKQKEQKKPLLAGHDEVVLSAESEQQAPVHPKTIGHEADSQPDHKGAFVDVKI